MACVEGRRPPVNAWAAVRYLAPGVMAPKSVLRDGELLEMPDRGDPPGESRPPASNGSIARISQALR